jgi:hypothetical protein
MSNINKTNISNEQSNTEFFTTYKLVSSSISNFYDRNKKYFYDEGSIRYDEFKQGITNTITLLWRNKLLVFMFSLLITFVILSWFVMVKNKKFNYIGDVNEYFSFWTLLLGTMFIILSISLILSYRRNAKEKNLEWSASEELSSISKIFGYDGFILFVIMFSVIFYIFYSWLNSSYPDIMSAINSTLILLIVIGGIALFINFFKGSFAPGKTSTGETDTSLTAWNVIKRLFFAIPCLFISFAEYIYKEYKITPSPTFVLLGIQLLLITLYIIMPNFQKIFNDLILHDGQDLVTEQVSLDSSVTLDVDTKSFQDKKDNEGRTNYNYALSSWVYLMDSRGSNYEKTIINYGNKPIIQFNDKTNTLFVKCDVLDDNNVKGIQKLYETSNIPLQRWNNFVFNFSGGTLDIFINGELVSSTQGVIPGDYKNEPIIIGDENGVNGSITDVTYYSHELSKTSISNIYKLNRNTVGNQGKPWWKFI